MNTNPGAYRERVHATVFVSGLLFSLSLIVAIGAQNAYVLRQGARREHLGTVVLICAASDVALIAAGVAGVGAVVHGSQAVLTVIRASGATLLLAYAALATRRALAGLQEPPAAARSADSRRRVVAATLIFTWLNPAVYLDTVVLLGSVANAHPGSQWWFGAGAAAASVSWFLGLGYAARLLTPVLRRPQAARLLDAFVAVVMTVTALRTFP
jgi:L-lysine exporter family protein LysE/ArgO